MIYNIALLFLVIWMSVLTWLVWKFVRVINNMHKKIPEQRTRFENIEEAVRDLYDRLLGEHYET